MAIKELACPKCHAVIETFDEKVNKGICPFCATLVINVQVLQTAFLNVYGNTVIEDNDENYDKNGIDFKSLRNEMDKIRETYLVDDAYTHTVVNEEIDEENILNHLLHGYNPNYRANSFDLPLFATQCVSYEVFELFLHFGIDEKLFNESTNTYVDTLSIFLFDRYWHLLVSLPNKSFEFISSIDQFEWLLNHEFNFNTLNFSKLQQDIPIIYVGIWYELANNDNSTYSEACDYILNKSNLDLTIEVNNLSHPEGNMCIWFFYVLDILSTIYDGEDEAKRVTRLEQFIGACDSDFDLDSTTLHGKNVFFIFHSQCTNSSRFDYGIKALIGLGADPYLEDVFGNSFYSLLISNYEVYTTTIETIEEETIDEESTLYIENLFSKQLIQYKAGDLSVRESLVHFCDLLGSRYMSGEIVEKDYYKAEEYYRQGLNLGNQSFQKKLLELGNIAFTKAGSGFSAMSEATDLKSVNQVFHETELLYKLAIKLSVKNATDDLSSLYNNYGVVYANGKFGNKDYEVAIKWYLEAINLSGNHSPKSIPIKNLFINYQDLGEQFSGSNQIADLIKSQEYFEKANKLKVQDLRLKLSNVYGKIGDHYNHVFKRSGNWIKACDYYEKAIRDGNEAKKDSLAKLYTILGDLNTNGFDTEFLYNIDEEEKKLLIEEANNFSEIEGSDFDVAESFYNKAIKLGDKNASSRLALLHSTVADISLELLERGKLDSQEYEEILKIEANLTKSIDLGNHLAKETLKKFYTDMIKKFGSRKQQVFNVVTSEKYHKKLLVMLDKTEVSPFKETCYSLAKDYNWGKNGPVDYGKAELYYLKSIELGYKAAQEDLGILYNDIGFSYESDTKLKDNYKRAIEYYEKSLKISQDFSDENICIQNIVICCFKVGEELFENAVNNEDVLKSAEYFCKSGTYGELKQNRDINPELVERIYEKYIKLSNDYIGLGSHDDLLMAEKLLVTLIIFKEKVEDTLVFVYKELANQSKNAVETERNIEKAVEYYKKIEDLGYPEGHTLRQELIIEYEAYYKTQVQEQLDKARKLIRDQYHEDELERLCVSILKIDPNNSEARVLLSNIGNIYYQENAFKLEDLKAILNIPYATYDSDPSIKQAQTITGLNKNESRGLLLKIVSTPNIDRYAIQEHIHEIEMRKSKYK